MANCRFRRMLLLFRMNSLHHRSRRGAAIAGEMPVLRAILIYEDLDAGLRAKRFCDKIEKKLGIKCRLQDRAWRFDVLAIPEVRNTAASEAAKADLVILSNSESTELPAKVREWLDMWIWLIDQANPALIALFGSPRSESVPVRTQLRNVTRSKGIDFFSTTVPQKVRSEPTRSIRQNTADFGSANHRGPFG